MDDIALEVIEAVRAIAGDVGIVTEIQGFARATSDLQATQISVSSVKEDAHERMYRVIIPSLPGGPSYMAMIKIVLGTGARHVVEDQQVRRMFVEHVARRRRVDHLVANGLDPASPPAWSIECHAATLAVMRAMGGRPEDIREYSANPGEGLRSSVPGLSGQDAVITLRDSIIKWVPAVDLDRAWFYDGLRKQIRIRGRGLPETACQAIVAQRMRIRDVVGDDVLDRVDTVVSGATMLGEDLILSLERGWEWVAPMPPGEDGGWREGWGSDPRFG